MEETLLLSEKYHSDIFNYLTDKTDGIEATFSQMAQRLSSDRWLSEKVALKS